MRLFFLVASWASVAAGRSGAFSKTHCQAIAANFFKISLAHCQSFSCQRSISSSADTRKWSKVSRLDSPFSELISTPSCRHRRQRSGGAVCPPPKSPGQFGPLIYARSSSGQFGHLDSITVGKGQARNSDSLKMAYVIFFALFAALRSRCIFRWASSLQASQQYLTFFLIAVKAVPQFSQIHSGLLSAAASCR